MIEYWWGHIDLTRPEGLVSRFYAKATCIAADILGEISFKERRKITNCGLHWTIAETNWCRGRI